MRCICRQFRRSAVTDRSDAVARGIYCCMYASLKLQRDCINDREHLLWAGANLSAIFLER